MGMCYLNETFSQESLGWLTISEKKTLEDFRRARAGEEATKEAYLRGYILPSHVGAPSGLRTVEDCVRQHDGFIASYDEAIAVLEAAPRSV